MPQHDVAAFADLPDAGLHRIERDGQKILLIRDADTVQAIGAECPHAGAPLDEGLLHAERIICPWHKAAFCIRSGAVLDPPAVDPLPRYPVEIKQGRVLVDTDPIQSPTPVQPSDTRHFVIIGGGGAGAVAAQTLREVGFTGRITMLDQGGDVPYDRTLLSKYVLSGEEGSEKTPLQTPDFYRQHSIDRVTAQVAGLDPAAHSITCADSTAISYDAALLATGATPVKPDLPGVERGNVFLLRDRRDADAILAPVLRQDSRRVVVLGTSFIGMEVAASLRERGLTVTVVGQEATPFETTLGPEVGRGLAAMHQEKGVSFRLGRRVKALEGAPTVQSVRLDNDEVLSADIVIIGFGVRPATQFLSNLPRNEDGSVSVDATLSVTEDLYAAGDIARFPDNGRLIRVEHWRVAQQHGRIAARNMAGERVRFDAVPYFWTIQYMKRVDYVGHAEGWDAVIIHGNPQEQDFTAYYVKAGIVTAAACMGRDRDAAALIELFNHRRDWTADQLGETPAALIA
jgi:apoptosis-inducing factor 3